MVMSLLILLLCAGVVCTQSVVHIRNITLVQTALPNNWFGAQNYCRTHHTDLVTLYSLEEEQILKAWLSEGVSNPRYIKAWIGFHGRLMASNGEPVDPNPDMISKEDPNYGGTHYCAIMPSIQGGNMCWKTCSESKPFLCYNKGSGKSVFNYTLINETKSWASAQNYCRQHHTDLASFTNQSQFEQIREFAMASHTDVWIGVQFDNRTWEWSNGGNSTYIRKPTDVTSFKYCGLVYAVTNFTLTSCSDTQNKNFCYEDVVPVHVIQLSYTWEKAYDYCHSNYRELVKMASVLDQRAVEERLRQVGLTGPVWVGLRQSRLLGFWIWSNGSGVGTYSNWLGGTQPALPLSNHCGALDSKQDFKWTDQNCQLQLPFICEGEPTS